MHIPQPPKPSAEHIQPVRPPMPAQPGISTPDVRLPHREGDPMLAPPFDIPSAPRPSTPDVPAVIQRARASMQGDTGAETSPMQSMAGQDESRTSPERANPPDPQIVPLGSTALSEAAPNLEPAHTPKVSDTPAEPRIGEAVISEEAIELAQRYGNLATPEKLMEVATTYDRDNALPLADMYGAVALSHLREERVASTQLNFRLTTDEESHPDVIAMRENLTGVAQEVAARDPRINMVDLKAATQRIAFSIVRHEREHGNGIVADSKIVGALWRTYLEEAMDLAEIGVKKPETAAIYNGPELIEHLRTSAQLKTDLHMVHGHPRAPLEAIEKFHSAVTPLQNEYQDHPDISAGVIREYARLNPTGTRAAVEMRVAQTQAARETYRDMVGAEEFFTWARSNVLPDPAAAAAQFDERRTFFEVSYADDADFSPEAVIELGLRAKTDNEKSLNELAAEYKDTLQHMRSATTNLPESLAISDRALHIAAATRQATTLKNRMRYARDIQNKMNRSKEA